MDKNMEEQLLSGVLDDMPPVNQMAPKQEQAPEAHIEQHQEPPSYWNDIPTTMEDSQLSPDDPHFNNFELNSGYHNLNQDSEVKQAFTESVSDFEPVYMPESDPSPISDMTQSENKLNSSFTLAQLAGDEEVEPHEREELAYERLVLLQSLLKHDENHALQTLSDSDIRNGSLSGERMELVGRALIAMRNESENFIRESLNKINDAVRDGKPLADGDIRFSERDPALFANLLNYSENKSSIGNQLLSFARNSVNSELIRESYANGGDYTANALGKAQKDVFESYTGVTLKSSLGTREILTDIVKQDIAFARQHNDYSLLIRAAVGNQDYKSSLVRVLTDDFSFENNQNKYDKAAKMEYINNRLKEINNNNSSDLKLNYENVTHKTGKSYLDITYSNSNGQRLNKDDLVPLNSFAKNHIAGRLNGVEPILEKREKLNAEDKFNAESSAEKNKGKSFDPKNPEYERQFNDQRYYAQGNNKQPYLLTSLYLLGKEMVKGAGNLVGRIGEDILKAKDYMANRNLKEDIEKGKEKISEFKSKATEFVAENVTPHIYDTRESLNKAEQAVYKPVEEFAGFKVSPKLHTHSFGQELSKMHEYVNAMNGVIKNPKNADLVFDKLGNFHGLYNSTIRNLRETPKNHSEFANEFDARIEAKKHAARIINDYQDLSVMSVEKRKFTDDLSKVNAYNELSKRGLGMTQQLAKPTMEVRSDMERKAHELYKDSLFLNYYANDLSNREKMGLDTTETKRRLEKRIESIAQEKFELNQMIKNANVKGTFKNKDEALMSLSKVNEYMDLSLDLENMAKLNSTAKKKMEELDKSKDKEFDLDKMLKNFAENTQKMLSSLSSLFSRKTSQMGASA